VFPADHPPIMRRPSADHRKRMLVAHQHAVSTPLGLANILANEVRHGITFPAQRAQQLPGAQKFPRRFQNAKKLT
jgi:hypothetical protein